MFFTGNLSPKKFVVSDLTPSYIYTQLNVTIIIIHIFSIHIKYIFKLFILYYPFLRYSCCYDDGPIFNNIELNHYVHMFHIGHYTIRTN